MRNPPPWKQLIDEYLIDGVVRFCERNKDAARLAILTGSYVRGLHNPIRPNVNIYVFSHPGKSADLRIRMGAHWSESRRGLREMGIAFRVDCHPYSASWRPEQDRGLPVLELTTKVLDSAMEDERFSLPPTIGIGWLLSHRTLWGESALTERLRQTGGAPVRAEWVASIHEALSHYRNMLDHLPNAVPAAERPEIFAEEACFYAIETTKDAISCTFSVEDLAAARHMDVILHKQEAAHLRSVGWLDLLEDKLALKTQEARILTGEVTTEEDAIEIWRLAMAIWWKVWDRYRRWAFEAIGEDCPWMLRVNAFV